jgi:predicted nuclease of predicted toxin-antitoxin system
VRIKLDENLPERLVPFLGGLGHDVDTVVAEHIAGQDDPVVWVAAQAERRFLITQDLDFSTCADSSRAPIMGCCS